MKGDALKNAPVRIKEKRFPHPFGRYILEKSISRGGMGEVFLAIAKGFNQRCVIKTIRADLVGDTEFVGRFSDEAKIMVRIEHGNIIRVFDTGKVGGDYYIAMEYVHGRDLGDVLDRAYERGEPLPRHLGLYISAQLLKGLHYAHNLCDETGRPMSLVHRDISPQNVLIGMDGSVKLIDFGLARTELLPGRTRGALAVGKYGYMSPEQARHERIDGRADVYSTGVMLFEVFTGDRLVDEADQATLWSRVLNPAHRLPSSVVPSLAPDIDRLIMRAVEKKAENRFASAEVMLKEVERLRTRQSNRRELSRYLKNLYPSMSSTPPPIPVFEMDDSQAMERSMIIASSREAAASVFGRGELPIEWSQPQPVSPQVSGHLEEDATVEAASVQPKSSALAGPDREPEVPDYLPDEKTDAADAGHAERMLNRALGYEDPARTVFTGPAEGSLDKSKDVLADAGVADREPSVDGDGDAETVMMTLQTIQAIRNDPDDTMPTQVNIPQPYLRKEPEPPKTQTIATSKKQSAAEIPASSTINTSDRATALSLKLVITSLVILSILFILILAAA
jgi:serine/threonine protein kinase